MSSPLLPRRTTAAALLAATLTAGAVPGALAGGGWGEGGGREPGNAARGQGRGSGLLVGRAYCPFASCPSMIRFSSSSACRSLRACGGGGSGAGAGGGGGGVAGLKVCVAQATVPSAR